MDRACKCRSCRRGAYRSEYSIRATRRQADLRSHATQRAAGAAWVTPARVWFRPRSETPTFCPDTERSPRSASHTTSHSRQCRWTEWQRGRMSCRSPANHSRSLADRGAEAGDVMLTGLQVVLKLLERAGGLALVIVHNGPVAIIAARGHN